MDMYNDGMDRKQPGGWAAGRLALRDKRKRKCIMMDGMYVCMYEKLGLWGNGNADACIKWEARLHLKLLLWCNEHLSHNFRLVRTVE